MLNHIKNFIIDMDGVLWHGDTPLPGLAKFFATLRAQNKQFVLATNNASKTIAQYEAKLARFGVHIEPEQVLTSAEATGDYLQRTYPAGTAVYVSGGIGLHEAMKRRGFRLISKEDVGNGITADVVVVGLNRNMVYDDLAAGTILINKGAQFIWTNPDLTFPSELGLLPGTGSFLTLIEAATGVKPITIGKPGPLIFQEALQRMKATPETTAMIGDRLNTDIAGGQAAGLQTILLLSGITQEQRN